MASIYDGNILSEKDKERVRKLGELWAQTEDAAKRQEYHEAAETIRRGYGYSGGDDGAQYDPIEQEVVSSALAAADYTNSLREAEQIRAQNYAALAEKAEKDGNERLRQAYIKNMQQSLGITQALRAEGLTGGISESTRAGLAGQYLNTRDSIMQDVDDTKAELSMQAAESLAESEKAIAQADYRAAVDRSEKMTAAEQRDYDRAQDAYQKEYQQQKDEYERNWEKELFEYQKELDAYDREYQAQKDAYDREYQAKNDELNRQHEMNKIYASKTNSSGSSSSSADKEEAEKLEELKSRAWKLLEKGVYDESFPELLGYSEEVLLAYMKNCMAGF